MFAPNKILTAPRHESDFLELWGAVREQLVPVSASGAVFRALKHTIPVKSFGKFVLLSG